MWKRRWPLPNEYGSGVIAHTELPDTNGPKVNMVVPRPGKKNQALTSRVGVTFTDEIAAETVTPENFSLISVGSNIKIDGYYGIQQGEVQFSPKALLQPNTEYKIVVRKGGIKDYAGNSTEETFESHFTTGSAPSITSKFNRMTRKKSSSQIVIKNSRNVLGKKVSDSTHKDF